MSNWIKARLDEVCYLVTDGTHHSPPNSSSGAYRYVTAKNIRPWGLDLRDISYVDAKTHAEIYVRCPVEKNDVLYIKDGVTTGLAVINHLDEPFSMLSSVALLKPRRNVLEPRYLKYWLNSPETFQSLTGEMTGSAIKRLVLRQIRSAEIDIAPFNEQSRIADQLDKLLARIQSCNDRLDAIPALLKRFRQAVLDAATLGELTSEWREESGQPFEWKKVRLQDIAEVKGGVTKDSKKQSASDEEVPYLRVANVQRGYIDISEMKTIRVPSVKLEELLLQSGDVLFNEGGDLDKLGRGWVWEGQITRCTFQNHVFRARLNDLSIQPKFLSWWGNSRGLEYFIRAGKQTTNLASINKTMLAALPISLPPAEEQAEIVRRVEALFKLADCIESRYATTRAHVQRLSPLFLAKAFRGELVPQDPNDEPARALLERIAAEREKAAAQPHPRKTTAGRKLVRAPKENAAVIKSRQDEDVQGQPYLARHLRQIGGTAPAEVLFQVSELPLADFYKQLAWEVAQGYLRDGRTVLELGDAA